jgi:hypothetical protein
MLFQEKASEPANITVAGRLDGLFPAMLRYVLQQSDRIAVGKFHA